MDSSMSRMALDNLIRRELKVSDPNDPKQVADALLTRYKDNPRAAAITREAQGVPFLMATPMPSQMAQAMTSSQAELQQAMDDVERDLQELTTSAILKDIIPELQGWASTIRSTIQEGANAARFALDARQRDKTFGIRRTLGDYARMARLVGALTPMMNVNYRKLAQSLDEVASVLLVMMGEALANVGFNGGRFLLQAPYSELQVRRDAVMYALRNLVGATQEAYGPNEWPRGVDAYRKLFSFLESQGQGDLRALLVENELVRVMDSLIHRAGQGSVDGLRQLGATAQLDVERLRRLVIIGRRAVTPDSPPLIAFLEALQLFIDAFESAGGFRLLRIARPPIVFYGIYGSTTFLPSDERLIQLAIQRGILAEQLDCFSQCNCDTEAVKCQIILDKILYDLDRSIDLYALGRNEFGEPEQRAAAYFYIIDAFLSIYNPPVSSPAKRRCDLSLSLETALDKIKNNLIGPKFNKSKPTELDAWIVDLVPVLLSYSDGIKTALTNHNLCGKDSADLCTKLTDAHKKLSQQNTNPSFTAFILGDITPIAALVQKAYQRLLDNGMQPPALPPVLLSFFKALTILEQELCIQKDLEDRWQDLVKTMAPNCVPYEYVFDATQQVINSAIDLVTGRSDSMCTFDITLPENYEVSLDRQTNILLNNIASSQTTVSANLSTINSQLTSLSNLLSNTVNNQTEQPGDPLDPPTL